MHTQTNDKPRSTQRMMQNAENVLTRETDEDKTTKNTNKTPTTPVPIY